MRRPNILFILLDDFGWRDLGCYGSGFYETPHLDLLAQQGMRFTDAYAAGPVCSPTRASLMTGKYPARLGITQVIGNCYEGRLHDVPIPDHLPLSETSLASALRAGGYRTWCVGKWHLGPEPCWPEHHGFDVNIAGCDWGKPKHGYFSPYGNPRLADGPEGEYLTDRLTDEAIRLLRQHDTAQPFFLYLSHYAVHTPIEVPERYTRSFEAKARMLRLDRQRAFAEGEPFPCAHKREQRVTRRLLQSDSAYAGMIRNLDENTGRLLAALDETGQAENTLVVFTSDNGGLNASETMPTCNAPLQEGKGWMYEGGIREPLLARWPGVVQPDSWCDVPATSPDIYPTLLEAAGLDPMPAQHCDGVSLMPLLTGRGGLDREAIYWHYPHYSNQGGTPGSSVRAGDHKLIEFFEDGHRELYDLSEDIGETRNLATERPEIADRLAGLLADWRRHVAAAIPAPNQEWDRQRTI